MFNEIASIVIRRPVEEVYDFLSRPNNRLKYDPQLIAVRQTPEGPLRLGTQITEVRRLLGKTGEMVTEVSDLQPSRLIGYRTRAGDPMNAFGAYRFEVIPEGTRLTLNFTLAPKGVMKLIVPFVAGGLKRGIASGLRSIKAVVENQPAHPTQAS
jgi:hypothetical protein